MLVSTPHTYLMHYPQCMQVKYMHEIGKEKISPLLRLGPAVVLGPADCDRRKPSSMRSR